MMDLLLALIITLVCSIIVQIGIFGPGLDLDGTFQVAIIFFLLAPTTLISIMGFGRIVGHAKTTFYHAQRGITLHTKDGRNILFADMCKAVIPPCHLNPFIFNGHLQTMWTVVKSQDVPIYYRRKLFENEDPTYTGTFAVDFVVRPYDGEDTSLPSRTTYFTEQEFANIGSSDTKPMLVTLHGLSGGSHELYLRHVLAPLVSEVGGWEACVVNSRGCAKSKITSSVLYNARATWDVRQTVRWLKRTFPNRPLFGIGFSLGANILTNVRMLYAKVWS
jgi:predicted alpha/beta-fold hydrolase